MQRILRSKIVDGVLKPGDKLPSEIDIADVLGVSKMTANKAILPLVADGLLWREVGRGTFVNEPPKDISGNVRKMRVMTFFAESSNDALESEYYQPLYRGLYAAIPPQEVEIVVSPGSSGDYARDADLFPSAGYLIFAPRTTTADSIRALAAKNLPVVVVGASWVNSHVPMVDSDNYQGAKEAVERLLEWGHRYIACIYAEPNTANTFDRLSGYRDALTNAGITPNPTLEIEGMASWQLGEDARNKLLALVGRGDYPVTAVFGAGYYIALEAMKTVQSAGFHVPDDVSFIGFDNPLSAWHVYPGLTTVEQPLFEMGKFAGEILLSRIRSGVNLDERVSLFPTQLIERDSAAPRPAPS